MGGEGKGGKKMGRKGKERLRRGKGRGKRGGKGKEGGERGGEGGEERGLDDFLYFTVTASFTHPCGCWEEGGGCDSGGWGRGEGQGRSVKCHTKDHLPGPPSKGKTIQL